LQAKIICNLLITDLFVTGNLEGMNKNLLLYNYIPLNMQYKSCSKHSVICHANSQNVHPTNKFSKKIYHFHKVTQKQFSGAHVSIQHTAVTSSATIRPHSGVTTVETS
jgi:hypothetical protein